MEIEPLLKVLRCPYTREPLRLEGESLVTEHGHEYPLVKGIPVFTPVGRDIFVNPPEHVSNPVAPEATRVAADADGLVLNLSAGGSAAKAPNMVELEYSIFRNTDVVGDAHRLPFADDAFSACICMNAFEHYRNPWGVAAEILRVLEPGGVLVMHTAGLQPLHESPHHFFNATCFGVTEWLSGFSGIELTVSPNFNPVYALAWLLSELKASVDKYEPKDQADLFDTSTLRDVAALWRDPASRKGPLWEIFQRLDSATQRACAAGWQAKARKPLARCDGGVALESAGKSA